MVARRSLAVVFITWAALPVAVSAILTHWLYQQPATVVVDFERRNEGGFISGFHGHERMEDRGFRWATAESSVRFTNLPRRSRLRIEVRLKGLRPKGMELPRVRFTANGATVFETRCDPGLVTYRFSVSLPGSSLDLGIHPEVFVPADAGRTDPRVLGVQIFSIRLEPQGGEPSGSTPTLYLGLAGAIFFSSLLAAGFSPRVAGVGSLLVMLGFTYLLRQASVRFLPYPQQVALLAGLSLLATLFLRAVLSRSGWPHASERPALLAVLVGGLLLKLAGLLYPLFVSSDADFHANRLLDVLEGQLFPTSVTQHQSPFRIPYPISLYLIAAPFGAMGLELVKVLQVVTAVADLGVSLALAYLARRFLNDARGGILAAGLYQIVPVNFYSFSSGNLTNLFGVATTVFFLTALLVLTGGGGKKWAALTFLFSLLAWTSHLGVALAAALLWPGFLGAAWLLTPGGLERQQKRRVGLAVTASVVVACLYYAGYAELFAKQASRLFGREYMTGAREVAGPLAKLAFNLPFYAGDIGAVFALIALLGAVSLLRRALESPLHGALAVWTVVSSLFLVADLFTSLELRYVLQAAPLLSLFAGSYLSQAFARGWLGRIAGLAACLYLASLGLASYRECLLLRYH
jgi:hypothetical protein